MLQEKSIRGLMLSNGAVVYATVVDQGTSYLVETPLMFRLIRTPEGEGIQPHSFLPTSSDEPITIEKIHVITTFRPDEQLIGMYQEATGAIITPPTQSLILP